MLEPYNLSMITMKILSLLVARDFKKSAAASTSQQFPLTSLSQPAQKSGKAPKHRKKPDKIPGNNNTTLEISKRPQR